MAIITGNGGSNFLEGTNAGDIINGLGGDDLIDAASRTRPNTGTDQVDGGDGIDTLQISGGPAAFGVAVNGTDVTVRSADNSYFVDAISIERIDFYGGFGNDIVDLEDSARILVGGGGMDTWIADYSAVTQNLFLNVNLDLGHRIPGLNRLEGFERFFFTAGSGNDRITTGSEGDSIIGGAGNDTIDAGERRPDGATGADAVDGGTGVDTLVVDASRETDPFGVFLAPSGTGFIVRSASNRLFVDAINMENTRFTGSAGNDTINTGSGETRVNGGAGTDHWIANLGAVTRDIHFQRAQLNRIDNDRFVVEGIERVTLTTGRGNDTIIMNGVIAGGEGDTIMTGAGNDTIDAGQRRPDGLTGTDVVDGGDGRDLLIVRAEGESGSISLFETGAGAFGVRSASNSYFIDATGIEMFNFSGGSGNDLIDVGRAGGRVDGNGGIDRLQIDLSRTGQDITFRLGDSSLSAARLEAIFQMDALTIETGRGKDRITGGNHTDAIFTGAGNDIVDARGRVAGGAEGGDFVDGGSGLDTLLVDASRETDAVSVFADAAGNLFVRANSDRFFVDAVNVERLIATGGSGADFLGGADGNDTLVAGSGSDRIVGGRGRDSLTGGDGDDRFLFGPGSGVDTIADFQDQGLKQDLIDVTAYGFASLSDIGKQASGTALILNFGGGNSVRLEGYLATHRISQINDDILI